jgi:hypothetical protein
MKLHELLGENANAYACRISANDVCLFDYACLLNVRETYTSTFQRSFHYTNL